MESIIVAMLYLYPGALVDVIRHRFFKRTFRDEELNESARVAKYFVFSTVISVFSLLAYAALYEKSVANPDDILKSLSGTMEIPKYFVISLLMTVVFVALIRLGNGMLEKIKSCQLEKTDGLVISPSVDAWHELTCGKGLEGIWGYLVLRIICGDHETTGFSYYLPERFQDGVAVIHQEIVADAFQKDSGKAINDPDRLIYGPVAAYFDTETGTTVEFYNGYNLSKTLK